MRKVRPELFRRSGWRALRALLCLVGCGMALTACGPSQSALSSATLTSAETDRAVALFADVCLDTLPRFDRFADVVSAKGMIAKGNSPDNTIYATTGDKPLLATLSTEEAFGTSCGVAFLGPDEAEQVAEKFADAVGARSQVAPVEQLSTRAFDLAVLLNNGSVMTQDARRGNSLTRHIILITQPVARVDIDKIISE